MGDIGPMRRQPPMGQIEGCFHAAAGGRRHRNGVPGWLALGDGRDHGRPRRIRYR